MLLWLHDLKQNYDTGVTVETTKIIPINSAMT